MKKRWLLVALALSAVLVAGCGSGTKSAEKETASKAASQTITLSVAASLKETVTELRDAYVKAHNMKPEQINLNFAGSGTLRQQIEQGAPSSIFISADEKNAKMLADKGLLSEVKPWVQNTLVLIVPKGKEQGVTFETLENVNRVAIGTVDTVPAGTYAKQVFEKLNLWEPLQPKIVYAKDVRAVLTYVSEGAVDAGVVYKTDALQAKDKVTIVQEAKADWLTPIVYPIGIITKNNNELTKDFYAYLTGPEGQKVAEKYGFTMGK